MKAFVLALVALFAADARGLAQWAVFDAANLSQSVTNHAAMVEQIARQAEQIANQVRQIQQMEERLKRMGNLAEIKAVIGFPDLSVDLNLPTRVRRWAERVADGPRIFGDTRGGVYASVESAFADFDGDLIERDGYLYAPEQVTVGAVDEFVAVQSDVYARREQLKQAITRTSDALQAAETEAEATKLDAVLNAQFSQLAAIDSEIALSAAEVQVRAAESAAMSAAADEADAETRRKLAQLEAKKATTRFTPKYECLLQYVTEKPFLP